ncbi:ATP-dependent DNA helicase RecG [Beijerinckiaceae bacterium RH AL1]|nr:ATP-dependent DNA helicase RecG [Beijerinckiaceae bacterium]VVB45509.1 ATP-dependent DNA helicase RecG [Beijerinckiaceae bacterium RH CH11]VVB45585.1 ATP-dependent DNA helicase RecG [Beijerinckiaceae bacterium RH AL8]VVC54901.1 ATP-dependent DNA helicase RecG [Beijerinckiaceae bacterium RH AL1]
MRPHLLTPFFATASALPGIGPKTGKLLDRLVGPGDGEARVIDVLFHLPHSIIDRRNQPKIAEAPLDQVVTLRARVTDHRAPPPRSRAPYKVLVEDDTGDVLLVFFLANHGWIEKSLPIGAERWISGKLELWDGHRQMVHPDHVVDEAGFARMPLAEPVYGLTDGLYPRVLAKAIDAALARIPPLPDWYEGLKMLPRTAGEGAQRGSGFPLPTFGEALEALHKPADPEAVAPDAPARLRLALDELFAHQIALALMRQKLRVRAGRAKAGGRTKADAIEAALPFKLTSAQRGALEEIRADLASDARMLRLLQGDVGSGKTLVALLAMADVCEAGKQAVLMAPTEILARQHFAGLAPRALKAGLRTALVTGRDTPAERRRTLEGLASGAIDIAIGTHALIQDSVAFRDLGLAVVDEQHRFGVHQRLALSAKGEAVDILVMTATPIPRTLVLSYFGDMDVSSLREKPPGRQPIDTRALPLERLNDVVARLERAVAEGKRAYWVCPLVAEAEESDAAAALERFEHLREVFGAKVGLVHGKMKGAEKDAAMAAFAAGETQVLVATTVIEVGVDVPEATIIVIEHAERFGLSQVHQLRGRVGRGAGASSCLLLFKAPLGEVAQARIEILRATEDGFRIAEEDLKLRGEGEILGTRQSGSPGFKLADLAVHGDLLPIARDAAQKVVTADPDLAGSQGAAVKVLLHLFEREEAIRLIEAG